MKKFVLLMILCFAAALVSTGCSKSAKIEEPAPAGEGAAVTGTETVTEKDAQRTASMAREDITGKYIEDVKLSAEFNDIYFDYDMYNIREDAKPELKKIASWLSQKDAKVIIEGHCDERGTNEYNLGLGDRRANSSKQYLVASGVSADKIETISYGEERPLCEAKTENCWSKNRRAHFVVLLPK